MTGTVDRTVYERVVQLIAEVLLVEAETLTPDSRLGPDCDADGLALVELAVAFEDAFEIDVPEDRIEARLFGSSWGATPPHDGPVLSEECRISEVVALVRELQASPRKPGIAPTQSARRRRRLWRRGSARKAG